MKSPRMDAITFTLERYDNFLNYCGGFFPANVSAPYPTVATARSVPAVKAVAAIACVSLILPPRLFSKKQRQAQKRAGQTLAFRTSVQW